MSGRSVRVLLVLCLAVAQWPASGAAPGRQPTSVGSQVYFEVVPPPPA